MKSNFDRTQIGKPPAGYIPGISRGCHGFVTRSDIGPMMADITTLAREQAIAVSKEREKHRVDSDEEDNTLNDVHFDTWGGFRNVKLFNNLVEDEEDKEAEEAYAVVDKYLEGRTSRKVAAIQAEEQRLKMKNPQARDALKDAIAEIKTLSAQDWAKIPESNGVGKKRYKEDKSTPVPDAIVNERLSDGRLGQALDRVVRATPVGTPGTQGADSVLPAGELSALADARRVLLEKSLSKTGMNSTLDKAGYKTALESSVSGRIGATGDFQDLKKARALYRSNVESNPSDPKAWIGVIRIEELDGKLEEARNIAAQAIIRCPFEDSVWLETIRIEPSIQGKRALAVKAVKSCPQSVKLWLAGADIETDKEAKIQIVEKALKLIPQSEKLWKYLIELAMSDSQAKEWLSTAVQCVPDHLDFHLALARLSDYAEAKEVLNAANKHFQQLEKAIWIHAAKLEEAHGSKDNCGPLIEKGLRKIAKKRKGLDREEWIDEAKQCEVAGCLATTEAVVKSIFKMDDERNDPSSVWIEDAKLAMYQTRTQSARIMYEAGLALRPRDSSLWQEFLNLENSCGTPETYKAVLHRAARSGGSASEAFVLQLAKKLLAVGQLEEAERHMADAVSASPENDQLLIGYVELLKRIGKISKCRELLKQGKSTPILRESIFRYCIRFEREQAQPEAALKEAKEARSKFSNSSEIACDLALAYEELGKYDRAREEYVILSKDASYQKYVRLWTQWMALEERTGGPSRARVIFEKAKAICPHAEEVWIAGITIEENVGDPKIVKPLLAESIKECPSSGFLRAKFIECEPLSTRIRGISEATKLLMNNPYLMNVAAKTFWHENKHEKTKTWFENSLRVDSKIGDTWAWYYLFLEETKQDSSGLITRCLEAEPCNGPFWTRLAQRPEHWNKSSAEILLMVKVDVQRDHMRIKR